MKIKLPRTTRFFFAYGWALVLVAAFVFSLLLNSAPNPPACPAAPRPAPRMSPNRPIPMPVDCWLFWNCVFLMLAAPWFAALAAP